MPLAGVRPAETLQTFTQVTNKFSWRHDSTPRVAGGSPWGTSSYICLQGVLGCNAPEESPEHLPFLVSRIPTSLNFWLGALHRVLLWGFLNNQSEAFCSWLICSWKKRAGVKKACLHPYTPKSIEELSYLPQKTPLPSRKNLSKVNKKRSLWSFRAVGWITALCVWQKECSRASPGGIPSWKCLPLTWIPVWPPAVRQMHLTGCYCASSACFAFPQQVQSLVPPCWTAFL